MRIKEFLSTTLGKSMVDTMAKQRIVFENQILLRVMWCITSPCVESKRRATYSFILSAPPSPTADHIVDATRWKLLPAGCFIHGRRRRDRPWNFSSGVANNIALQPYLANAGDHKSKVDVETVIDPKNELFSGASRSCQAVS